MDSDYIKQYRTLYEKHWWWRSRETAVLAVINEFRDRHSKQSNVLDIGCGDGLFFQQLSQFGVVNGIEVDSNAVSADGPYRDRITVAPFNDQYQPHKTFDLITMLDVLEHIEDAQSAMQTVRRLLSKQGMIVLTVPAHQWLWTGHDVINHHQLRYSNKQLNELLQHQNFEVITIRHLFHWLVLAKLLVRGKEALFGQQLAPPKCPVKPVNSLLKTITRWELRRGKGLGLPFGCSLIAVARKHEQIG